MTVDISLLIAFFSLVFSILLGVVNVKRNTKNDNKKEASELTTVIVELKYISNGINDIKREIGDVRADIQGLRDRVSAGEESIKQAHKRIDELKHRMELYHEYGENKGVI